MKCYRCCLPLEKIFLATPVKIHYWFPSEKKFSTPMPIYSTFRPVC